MSEYSRLMAVPEVSGLDPEVCGQCSRQGITCCQSGDSGLEMRFPLSPSEIEMLRPFAAKASALCQKRGQMPACEVLEQTTGLSGGPGVRRPEKIREADWFYTRVINTKYFVDALCVLFPGEGPEIRQLYPVGGERSVLTVRKSEDGSQPANADCVFLEAAGCMLPREARPWHCRLFPLWSSRGKPRLLDVEGCLAARQASALAENNDKIFEELLRMLHTDLNGFQDLYKSLRAAWGLSNGCR